jgi:hypothetical protein
VVSNAWNEVNKDKNMGEFTFGDVDKNVDMDEGFEKFIEEGVVGRERLRDESVSITRVDYGEKDSGLLLN